MGKNLGNIHSSYIYKLKSVLVPNDFLKKRKNFSIALCIDKTFNIDFLYTVTTYNTLHIFYIDISS